MFFKSKPNLPDAEKARIEYSLQQIAESIGFDRFTLPVLSRKRLFEFHESAPDHHQLLKLFGDHLSHDVSEVQLRWIPQQTQEGGGCGSGCGGGSCDGPSGLPGQYEANERSITLEMDRDPYLGIATLIHGVVSDLLHQNQFGPAHLPEQVELAVIGTGLGMLRNNISLVKKHASHWDSTRWDLSPRPFLDCQSLAYANAIGAWARNQTKPEWANDLPSDIKRPMQSSLKYLVKTNDSFFDPRLKRTLLTQSSNEWWNLATSSSASKQVIALRHLESGVIPNEQQNSMLLEKLRSANLAIVLNGITAIERIAIQHETVASESVISELSMLTEHRSDEVRAKAICALARMGRLDDHSIETAATMLEDDLRHLMFAGLHALSTLKSVTDEVLSIFDRCFCRALRTCDYEFIDLYVAAYKRWLDDPQSHFEDLLQNSPEHLPIALETLQKTKERLVQIRLEA